MVNIVKLISNVKSWESNCMQYAYLILFLLTISLSALAQVYSTPTYATENDSIIVFFDATQGDQGLMGYTGIVYAHTGVITNYSTGPSDWKYVIAPWGVNLPKVVCNAGLLAFALLGVVLQPGRKGRWVWLFGLACLPLPYYVTHVSPNYRAFVDPIMCFLVAGSCAILGTRLRDLWRRRCHADG